MPSDILHDYIIGSHFLADEVVVLGGVIFFPCINTKRNLMEWRTTLKDFLLLQYREDSVK